jgi:hypothetical protein
LIERNTSRATRATTCPPRITRVEIEYGLPVHLVAADHIGADGPGSDAEAATAAGRTVGLVAAPCVRQMCSTLELAVNQL